MDRLKEKTVPKSDSIGQASKESGNRAEMTISFGGCKYVCVTRNWGSHKQERGAKRHGIGENATKIEMTHKNLKQKTGAIPEFNVARNSCESPEEKTLQLCMGKKFKKTIFCQKKRAASRKRGW